MLIPTRLTILADKWIRGKVWFGIGFIPCLVHHYIPRSRASAVPGNKSGRFSKPTRHGCIKPSSICSCRRSSIVFIANPYVKQCMRLNIYQLSNADEFFVPTFKGWIGYGRVRHQCSIGNFTFYFTEFTEFFWVLLYFTFTEFRQFLPKDKTR